MPFFRTARTILQLGGELISSDEIAFFDLLRNASEVSETGASDHAQ